MIPVIRRWDDSGALPLDGTAGSLRVILKDAALAAGWTVEYEDTVSNKLVIRNDMTAGGNDAWVRLEEGAQEAVLQCYESMTDIDTGSNPASALNSGAGVYIRKSESASSATRPYVVAFDALRFYGSIYSNGTAPPAPTTSGTSGAYTTMFGAGAPDLFIPADPSVFVAGRDASGGQYVASGLGRRHLMDTLAPSTDYGFALSRDASGSASPTAALLLCVGASNNPTTQTVGHGNANMPAGVSAPGLGGHVVAPALIAGGGTYRGRLPGLFVPLTAMAAVTHLGDTVTPVATASPRTLVVLAGYSSNQNTTNNPARLLVDTGDWHA